MIQFKFNVGVKMKIYKIAQNDLQKNDLQTQVNKVNRMLDPSYAANMRKLMEEYPNFMEWHKPSESTNKEEVKMMEQLFQQVQEEKDRFREEQRIRSEEYHAKCKREREEEKRFWEEFSQTNTPFVEEFLRKNSFDIIMNKEKVSKEDTLSIIMRFLQTVFKDFTTEIVLRLDPNEEGESYYVNELQPYEVNELFMDGFFDMKIDFYPKDDIIRFLLQTLNESQQMSFDQFVSSIEYSRKYSTGAYFTTRQYNAEEEKRRQEEEKRNQEDFERDTKAYEEQTQIELEKWEAYKKKKGLPEDLDFEEFKAEKSIIEDELAWEPEMAESYRKLVREDPFEERLSRESFFKTWYANSDWTYEDDEQQDKYWKQKVNEKERQTQNNTFEQERERQEREEKAKKSSEWKTIDDMLVFAEKHGINLKELNPKDFKGSCKKIYRQLSHYFHPDKYTDPNKKKWAEEEFKKIQNLWDDFKKIHKIAYSYNWYKNSKG